uniref:Uncharacterized protein n=1 Tax=Nothobranchius furzeri TaxID=105023 RepID=A0A8C6KQN7_NOTFU
MKTFVLVAAVGAIITFISLQESSAAPVAQVTTLSTLMENMMTDSPDVVDPEVIEETWRVILVLSVYLKLNIFKNVYCNKLRDAFIFFIFFLFFCCLESIWISLVK